MPLASELVQSCTSVFTLPDLHTYVRDVVENADATTEDLAKVLKLDPAISARLLRIANGPLHGASKEIDTITGAVNLIGVQAVKDLVTETTVGQTFSGMLPQFMDAARFWRKSLFCALVAERMATSCGVDNGERCFVVGLLRDIGHFVLYQTVPQRAQSALIEAGYLEASLAEVEQSNIGCDFAEVGAELIRSWELPVQLEQAIRCQLSPKDAGEFELHASLVHLAGVVADNEELEPNRRHEVLPFDSFAVTATQFATASLPALLSEAHDHLQDTLALIHPPAMAA
ncbi:MAG: HDOD domain-containing protein [Nitrospira sp.]|nr:HDOD domain-containing protein [Nitrospira sp.]MDH4245819.1 HDOD domain-containing protein [Nitrospira sp.]MDH4357557.1 HDOD domain-containing protein [Nitrospira sp.]MDH5320468.1 HDOD domain-containing protein [Nitrospira sp.]